MASRRHIFLGSAATQPCLCEPPSGALTWGAHLPSLQPPSPLPGGLQGCAPTQIHHPSTAAAQNARRRSPHQGRFSFLASAVFVAYAFARLVCSWAGRGMHHLTQQLFSLPASHINSPDAVHCLACAGGHHLQRLGFHSALLPALESPAGRQAVGLFPGQPAAEWVAGQHILSISDRDHTSMSVLKQGPQVHRTFSPNTTVPLVVQSCGLLSCGFCG